MLVHGRFETPTWAYSEELHEQSAVRLWGKGRMEIPEEATSDEDTGMDERPLQMGTDLSSVPWVEIVKGNQKRQVGSKVWRVRRDLGRNNVD